MFPNFSDKPVFKTNKFNDSLRSYFRQLSNCIALILPLFYTNQYRFSRIDSLKKKQLIDTCMEYFDLNTNSKSINDENIPSLVDDYIRERINEFEISSNGLCKYCNMFNINLIN